VPVRTEDEDEVVGDGRVGWRGSERRQMMVEKVDERDLMIFSCIERIPCESGE